MFGRIMAVAANTRKEAFRNKAFIVLVILGVMLNATGWVLAKLAVNSTATRVVQNFGYFAVSSMAVLTAILMGVILLYKELDQKTIFTLVPKPVYRWEIVVGKFLGLVELIAGLIAFLGICWAASLWWHEATEVAGAPILAEIAKACILILLEATLITALALMFSSWTRPFLSGMFTFGYFLMGRWVFLLEEHLAASSGALAEPGLARNMVRGVTYVVPDLQIFNTSTELSLGIPVHMGYIGAAAGYALAFSTVFLVVGAILLSRRDFV